MNETYDDIKQNLLKLKKEGKITDKLRVFLFGYLQGLFEENAITLEQTEELQQIGEIKKADPFGVGELVTFGNLVDYIDSKLEF